MRAALVVFLLVAAATVLASETLPFGSPERYAAFDEYIALCSPGRDASTFNRSAELRELLWGERSGFVPSYRSGIGLRTGEPVRTNATQIPPMTVYVDHSNYTFTAGPVKFDTDFKRSHQQVPCSLGMYYSY